jgi:cyclopropane fatty-acyl-phospholipid synthase-like methyltransferase
MRRRSARARLGAALAILGLAAPAFAQHSHGTHDHSFTNAEQWARYFDDPARDAWQKPDEVIKALKLAPDAVVADIGAGTGYFAVRLARAVPSGTVFAVDREPDMTRYLAERAKRDGLQNLTPVLAGKPALPRPADVALLVDVYHHIHGRVEYFAALRKQLTPGGRVAIIDFTQTTDRGPPRAARVAPPTVQSEMARAGYALVEEHGFLPDQYFLVFAAK